MNNQELVTKFNPANAANLTAEDLETLRNLTGEQITVLANAYPNQPTRRAYLILYDQNLPANKQLFQLSTWQNLNNVRKFANRKSLIPWTFKEIFARNNKPAANTTMTAKPGGLRVPVDLTANEAAAELQKSLDKKGGDTQLNTAQVTNPRAAGGARGSSKKVINTSDAPNGLNVEGAGADASDSVPDDQQFGSGE